MSFDTESFMRALERRNEGDREFLQAVREVLSAVEGIVQDNEQYLRLGVIERLTEPDRTIQFRVTWQDDDGGVRVNRGWRVQHSNAIGPYKGGMRFHPSVNASVLQFLAFEQTFKNALTGLPMGAAKGGSDFDPKGKSDDEVMRFCQSFVTELIHHIGAHTDIPAGDIGVGSREIGFMFGQYKKITNTFSGVLTGKGLEFGGAPMRPEATGYGLVHFLECMLDRHGRPLEGRSVTISGAGNVATHAAAMAAARGAKVLTLSNSDGTLVKAQGFSGSDIDRVRSACERLDALSDRLGADWRAGEKPWGVHCDIALPCATQNELEEADAEALVGNGVMAVAEGANMPCTPAAIGLFRRNGVLFGPGKAANAGGVALSGLEMSQNASFGMGDRECMAERLETIMRQIHDRCAAHAGETSDGPVDYARGANIAGFRKVADAMVAFGVV